jgi:hypothetical protein
MTDAVFIRLARGVDWKKVPLRQRSARKVSFSERHLVDASTSCSRGQWRYFRGPTCATDAGAATVLVDEFDTGYL